MLSRNTARRILATLMLLVLTATAPARPTDPDTGPDPADVVAAWQNLQQWLSSFDAPSLDSPNARVDLRRATGVAVIIRLRGRVLGTGLDTTGDDLMLRRAAGRAMADVLGHELVQQLDERARAQLGLVVTAELEVAGELTALPGRTYADVNEQLNPGLDGVALKRDDRFAVMFPSQMRAAGIAAHPGRLLKTLAVELGLPPLELNDLSRRFGARAYRFRTIHLAQRAPGRVPRETFRGQQLVPSDDITEQALLEMGDGLIDHLITSLWTDEEREGLGLMGDYRPVSDTYAPAVASARDQALTAFALARFGNLPQLHPAEAERARSAAIVILSELAAVEASEDDPRRDAPACAAVIYALSDLPEQVLARQGEHGATEDVQDVHDEQSADQDESDAIQLQQLIEDAVKLVASARADAGRVVVDEAAGGGGRHSALSLHAQAMVAGALCRSLAARPGVGGAAEHGAGLERAREVLDVLWSSVPQAELLTLMPWLAWAEADFAAAADRDQANIEPMESIASILAAVQIGGAISGDPDLEGGFALSRRGRLALADAQSTRPMVFLGWLLRQQEVYAAGGVMRPLARQLEAMRFLRQLTVEDSLLWATRVPQRALGGVRAAPWELDQPLAAQGMGLLAVAETLHSLHVLAEREANP